MSIALARRYRPRRFADLLVQDHVAAALRGAVARERVGHGYLLTGPRGVGKTTAARILAMALNCANRGADGEPCGECESCRRISAGQASLDVVEIDAASNRGVDDARDLRERAMYAASEAGHHKVYIVDEAHMLTREAWNALLKILEEPPPGVVFVFATTEPQKIANAAAPVMSRLQRFDFRRIGPAAIRDRLREVLALEGVESDEDALLLIARHADGGMRDALSVLDQCLSFGDGPLTAARVRDVLGLVDDEAFGAMLDLVAARRPGDVFPVVDQLADSGADLVEIAGGLAEIFRAILMVQYGAEPPVLAESTRQLVQRAASEHASEDVVRMLKLLGEAEAPLRRSANPRLVLETLLLRWSMMDRASDLKALLEGRAPRSTGSAAPYTTSPSPTIVLSGSDRSVALGHTPAPAASPTASPPVVTGGQDRPVYAVPWTDEGIRAAWPDVVDTARRQSRFLGQMLESGTPRISGAGTLVVAFGPDQAVAREGVERQLPTVQTIASARLGTAVTITLAGSETVPSKSGRMTVEEIRRQRLGELRKRDPALDAAAEALDLEMVDDG
jgi:DNA polymerase-3 subunit gamma/tau